MNTARIAISSLCKTDVLEEVRGPKATRRWQKNNLKLVVFILLFSSVSCGKNAVDSQPEQELKTSEQAEETVPEPDVADSVSGSDSKQGSLTREQLSQIAKPASRPSGPVDSITTSKSSVRQAETVHDIDPHNDGWDSEVFAGKAGKQIKRIGALLQKSSEIDAQSLADLVTNDFSCSLLRPSLLEKSFDDGSLSVQRGGESNPAAELFGNEGLTLAIVGLREGLEGTTNGHTKFKLIRVTPTGNDDGKEIETTAFFESTGFKDDNAVQINATWLCRWQIDSTEELPKLSWIGVLDHEEVMVRNSHGTLFSDCTESVFEHVAAFDQQLRHSIDYWRARLETYLGIYFDGHHGLALGDVNGDGLDDLYVCEPGGLPNRLFLQTNDGSLRDISSESGTDFLDHSRSALLVDLDNDGDQDLVLSMENRLKIFANDGHAKFSQTASLDVNNQKAYSLSAADIDQDGDIDIYACFYHGVNQKQNRLPDPIPYHDARTGGPNRLFRNDGQGNFEDATEDVGLDHNNFRWSFASAWEDIDNDGDQDLYVTNDFGRNNLYRNDNGKFTDVAGPTGAEDQNFGMSISYGDYNRDGWMDLYISNMFSSAGGRVSYQPQFQTGSSTELKSAYQRLSRGNTLLENIGTGLASSGPGFRDVSEQTNVTMGRWAWGSLFADINNDGWDDLVVSNGYITGKMPDDL